MNFLVAFGWFYSNLYIVLSATVFEIALQRSELAVVFLDENINFICAPHGKYNFTLHLLPTFEKIKSKVEKSHFSLIFVNSFWWNELEIFSWNSFIIKLNFVFNSLGMWLALYHYYIIVYLLVLKPCSFYLQSYFWPQFCPFRNSFFGWVRKKFL